MNVSRTPSSNFVEFHKNPRENRHFQLLFLSKKHRRENQHFNFKEIKRIFTQKRLSSTHFICTRRLSVTDLEKRKPDVRSAFCVVLDYPSLSIVRVWQHISTWLYLLQQKDNLDNLKYLNNAKTKTRRCLRSKAETTFEGQSRGRGECRYNFSVGCSTK